MDGFCKSLHLFRTNVHSTLPGVKTAQPEPGYPPAIKKHRYVFTAMRKTHCIFRRSGDTFGGGKSRAEEQERRHQGHPQAGRKVAPGRRPGRGGALHQLGPGAGRRRRSQGPQEHAPSERGKPRPPETRAAGLRGNRGRGEKTQPGRNAGGLTASCPHARAETVHPPGNGRSHGPGTEEKEKLSSGDPRPGDEEPAAGTAGRAASPLPGPVDDHVAQVVAGSAAPPTSRRAGHPPGCLTPFDRNAPAMVQVGTPEVVVMAPELDPEVQRALSVLERGFRARVARRLRDRKMPAVEIAEVLDVTRASVYRYLSETEGNES